VSSATATAADTNAADTNAATKTAAHAAPDDAGNYWWNVTRASHE